MPIVYNDQRITPAPIVNISKSYKRLGSSQKTKAVYTLTVEGKILANMGSPINDTGTELNINFQGGGSGTFSYPADSTGWTIREDGQHMVMMKQQALRELFSEDNKEFEIIPWNGQPPIRCFPRVISIEFPKGLWFKYCDYVITLETDYLIGASIDAVPTEDLGTLDSGNIGIGETFDFVRDYSLEDASDTISLEMDSENYGIFKATRNLSAKGYRSLDTVGAVVAEGWQNARSWVMDRMGFSPSYIQSGVFGNLSGQFTNYNHYRTENTDIYNGSYSATETWMLSSGNFYEDYSADVRQSVTDPYKTVAVQGTINGLTDFVVGTDAWIASSGLIKYQNASGAWSSVSGNLYLRAQQNIGIALNPTPVTQTITHNFTKGVITYNYEFNNRPLALVSGAISETLSVIDSNPSGLVNTIGSHTIIGRVLGPILQDIGTTEQTKRIVNYECVFESPTYSSSGTSISSLMSMKPREQVNQLLSGLVPSNYVAGYLFVTQDEENYNPLQPRYSRNYTWTYNRAY